MDKNAAIVMARSLMTEHGVGSLPFGFHHNPEMPGHIGRTGLSECGSILIPNKITIDEYWIESLSTAEVREVILHEIAHARVIRSKETNGHGIEWQRECVRLGIKPNVKFRSNNTPHTVR